MSPEFFSPPRPLRRRSRAALQRSPGASLHLETAPIHAPPEKTPLGRVLISPAHNPAPAPSRSATVPEWTLVAGLGPWLFGTK